jgi:cell division ATPase FtsA
VARKVIDLIVNARAGELMTLLREAMKELSIVPDANPVTYVTGGGMVMMKGALEYLQVNLQLNAKKDEPWAEDMNTPNFTSTFAVLDFVIRASGEEFVKEDNQEGSVFSRIRDLFK